MSIGGAVLRRSQIVPEAVVGTALAPTRQFNNPLVMNDDPERRLRESQRASMFGPLVYDDMSYSSLGTYTGRAVFNELPFFLAMCMRGDIAPVANLWTYTQSAALLALKSMTVYCGTNVKALRSAGTFCSRLEISGSDTDWWRINAALLGRQQVVDDADAATFAFNNALTTPVAEGPKNKKTIFSIDEPGGTMGATIKLSTGLRFRWVYDAKIAPFFGWDTGALDMSDIQRDIPEVTLELTTLWNTVAVAEWKKRRDLVNRLIRLENSGSTGFRARIDGSYMYTGFEPLAEERDGTQLGRLMLTAVEDTSGYNKKSEVSVLNTLTAADLPVV
jgi:hypothetical protein